MGNPENQTPLASATPSSALQWVVCLCAQWCGTCRDYRAVFDQLANENPNSKFVWVDVEDQADVIGDLDIETFPLLLLLNARDEVLFFAPLHPQATALQRLLNAAQAGQLPMQTPNENLQPLIQYLQTHTHTSTPPR